MNEYRDRYPYEIYTYNVFGSGIESFEQITAERGVNTENLNFPILVVGSKVYSGMEAIESNLVEAFLTAGEDIFENKYVYYPAKDAKKPLFERSKADRSNATLVYFYRIVCEECQTVKPVIDSLPETILSGDDEVGLDIVRINTRSGNNDERVRAFFKAYNVPEEDQMVPIVFLADTYLAGYENISKYLVDYLKQGAGMGFEFPKND
jgi:hypothetical protein